MLPEEEKEVYYKFLADISYGIVIDQEGYIYNTKNGQNSELLNGINYNSGMSYDTYNGDIDCASCYKLESLEGCPPIVKSIDISNCYNLRTLKGGPKKVYESFDCSYCYSLTSLEGAPNIVDRNFRCVNCHNLKSFKGAPKKIGITFNGTGCVDVRTLDIPYMTIGRNFVISSCKNLTSLEGAPKKIDDSAECDKCYSVRSLKGLPDNMKNLFMKENSINTLDGCPKVMDILDLHNVGETPLFTADEIRAISGAKYVII
jgi:hypothetical protein